MRLPAALLALGCLLASVSLSRAVDAPGKEETPVFNQKCHTDFIKCLDKHANKDHEGFAPNTCPYKTVIPTMKAGIQMAMMFTGGFKGEEEF
ncbi:hypothetical protein GPECTOR_247g605 [Gonium pectorale]|uniref:Uncharacterized protein n=1 Tax=Gonium pectorale TaxID=33097 RepID=A0A150FXI7_GONPE|nr:hypothetical protein GPECTOR_247g605 [Gonium pectorale]|eukprot:KXZ41905.1 hypothetical protein GPECTOR_247g605 [Gonium pectorale]